MTWHCAPACHSACSASAAAPAMTSPALFYGSIDYLVVLKHERPVAAAPSAAATAPLLGPKPAGSGDDSDYWDGADCLYGVLLVSPVVVAAVIVLFIWLA